MQMMRYRCVSWMLLLGGLSPSFAGAQEAGRVVGGEVGAYLGISHERDRSRSATVGQLYVRPTISLYGGLTMTLDFLLSTGNEPLRSSQSPARNQYSVGLDWGWARADIGDVKQSYSPLTLDDVSVRGGGLSGRRGAMRFSAFGGRSAPASRGGEPTSLFDRNLYGGRVGVGDTTSLALDVIMIEARDDVGRFRGVSGITATDTQVGGVAPQENRVVGAVGRAKFLGDALSFRGELMRSGFTPDLRAGRGNDEFAGGGPDMGNASADYAHSLQATVRLAPLTTTATYRNVGSGYRSLGAPSLATDRRELGLSATLRSSDWNFTVDGLRYRDNLSGEKTFTTAHTRLRANLALRPVKNWKMSVSARRQTKANDSEDADRLIDQQSWILGTGQGLTISKRGVLRSASIGYEYQMKRDANPLPAGSESLSHAFNVRAVTNIIDQLQVIPSLRLVTSNVAVSPRTVRRVYGMRAQHRTKGGMFRSGLDVSWTEQSEGTWWEMTLTSSVLLGSSRR